MAPNTPRTVTVGCFDVTCTYISEVHVRLQSGFSEESVVTACTRSKSPVRGRV